MTPELRKSLDELQAKDQAQIDARRRRTYLGTQSPEHQRQANVQQMVNAKMRSCPWMSYDQAWAALKVEQPEHFANAR